MDRTVLGTQNVSRMCMVCGVENSAGLKARFLELEGNELLAEFTPAEEHQGYPGRLHGGIASTLLDEAMGRAINIIHPDVWGVTVELAVKFRKPVPLDQTVRAICAITRDTSRLFESKGQIVLPDGSVAIEATGKYMKLPIDRIADGDFELEWFADDRPAQASVELP
ncbi:MAG: PaaI family thioesterase [Actinomycetota bacterium]|nr:PaaI family thioesterase [Actinomycetota bacterium]